MAGSAILHLETVLPPMRTSPVPVTTAVTTSRSTKRFATRTNANAALRPKLTITFTPHLLPLDQGELVSCYVSPARRVSESELRELYAEAYRDEPFVEVVAGPPGVRAVRDTNLCRVSVHLDSRTGRVIAFGAIDNLWKGAASQAVQNLNAMYGRDESEGLR